MIEKAWRRLKGRLHFLRRLLRPDVLLLTGRTADGRSVTLLRAGPEDHLTRYFFAAHVLADLREERAIGRRWLWSLPSLGRRLGCSFVLVRTSTRAARTARWLVRRKEEDSLYVPPYVGATVDVTDEGRLLRSSDLRNDIRRLARRGFSAKVSRSPRDLEEFVRRYRDPYYERVHGFGAIRADLDPVFKSCSDGRLPEPWLLLKIELDGQWVAGDLLVSGPETAALMEAGIRDGDPALLRAGAAQAAYWLSLQYLRSQGHRWVSLMYSPPFLNNGALKYKLKFSPRLAPAPFDGFLVLPILESDMARDVLLREPLLALRGGVLHAVSFLPESSTPADCPPHPDIDRLRHAGISQWDLIHLAEPSRAPR